MTGFGFLTRARIIRKDLQPNRPIFYGYDLLGLLMAYSAWSSWQDLAQFRDGVPLVTVSLHEVALLGFIGFYGLRIAMFIAMARRLVMPQRAEWLVAIVPASITLVCLLLTNPIERVYISSQGYRECSAKMQRRWTDYTFAAATAKCPPEPINISTWHKPARP